MAVQGIILKSRIKIPDSDFPRYYRSCAHKYTPF